MTRPKYPPPPAESKVDWQDRERWHQWQWGPWSRAVAPYALIIMIQRAREARPITYEDLARQLRVRYRFKEKPRKTVYGLPIGLVGRVVEELAEHRAVTIPPLNVIVVNKYTKLPGEGADALARNYFKIKHKQFGQHDRRTMLRLAIDDVTNYGEQWAAVARDLGADLLPLQTSKLDHGKSISLPKIPKHRGGESIEHKRVKQWVMDNPDHFKRFGKFKAGKPEYQLSSGDNVDVHFDNKHQRLAVEVKPSHATDNEMKRGVYQVVKYRSVMQAEQRSCNCVPNAMAILVSVKRPNKDIKALMARLQVVYVPAPEAAERP